MADPWWRFYCETISDRKFKYIAKICGLTRLEILGAWSVICTIGHESPRYGALLVTLLSRVTVTDLAEELEIPEEKTDKMLAAMVDKDMLEVEEDGTFFVKNLKKRQYKDQKAAERQQKHRDTLRVTLPVTLPVTHTETETETELTNSSPLDDFLSKADSWIGCPIAGKDDVASIEVMVDQYGLDRVKLAATWINEKDTAHTMRTALKAMNSALSNGGFKEESSNGKGKKKISAGMARLLEGV